MSQRPRVKPHVEGTPKGKGDEAIKFRNGSRIEFGARDSGFGRGRTDVDVIVFDEGQHLSTEALENMGAAQNVAQNPLTFVMGTPPRPRDKGEFFRLLRQEALDGDSDGTLYIGRAPTVAPTRWTGTSGARRTRRSRCARPSGRCCGSARS